MTADCKDPIHEVVSDGEDIKAESQWSVDYSEPPDETELIVRESVINWKES